MKTRAAIKKEQPTRKQVVAKQNLEQAVKECERVGLKVEVKFK